MKVRPKHAAVHDLRGLKDVVMVVPVDPEEREAQDVRGEGRDEGYEVGQLIAGRLLRPSTMIVIRMARTPSLNASIRPLLTADPSRRAAYSPARGGTCPM